MGTAKGVDITVGSIAAVLGGRIDELTDAISARIQEEVAELQPLGSTQLWQTVRDGTRRALEVELKCLLRDREIPSRCPPDAAESARLAAAAKVPVTALLHTQRIGHAIVWDAYATEAERREADAARRKALLDVGARFFFAYADALAHFVSEEHLREAARSPNGSERKRLRTVLDLLEGTGREPPEADYDLELEHVAAVIWGADARTAVEGLGRALDRRRLTVSAGDGVLWAWFGAAGPDGDALALRGFDPGDAAVALGSPARGLEGFRRSHRDAQQAYRIALRKSRPVTRFADVAMEALVLGDAAAAGRLVDHELGPLGRDDRGIKLRETLCAYFRASQNAAAAAAALGVHEQTVAQRLRVIEERIGVPVNERRAELEVALRLENVLDE